MRISWVKAKKKLAILWFTGAGIIFLIIFLQTVLGKYGDEAEQTWSWFLPTIMPTLSLIIGVLVVDAKKEEGEEESVKKFFFKLTYTLSFIYLVVVFSTILIEPFSPFTSFDLMERSNLWLAPFQGLTSASLGVFFVQKGKDDKKNE